MKKLLFIFCFLFSTLSYGQSYNNLRVYYGEVIGSQAQDPSSMLDIQSSTKGFLLPRMTAGDRNAIVNPSKGLMVYQTDGTAGIYYNAGTPTAKNWTKLGGGGSITGTPTQVPYFGTDGNLTSDAFFTRDSIDGTTLIRTNLSQFSGVFEIIPSTSSVISFVKNNTDTSYINLKPRQTVINTDTFEIKNNNNLLLLNGKSIDLNTHKVDKGTAFDSRFYQNHGSVSISSMANSDTYSKIKVHPEALILGKYTNSTSARSLLTIDDNEGYRFDFKENMISGVKSYVLPRDTGSVGQVLAVNANDGVGNTTLSWQDAKNWSLTGNSGTNPAVDFIGTTDSVMLVIRNIVNDGSNGISVYGKSDSSGWGTHIYGLNTSASISTGLLLQGGSTSHADIELSPDNGKLKLSNISEGLGKVLTSDASGFATWQSSYFKNQSLGPFPMIGYKHSAYGNNAFIGDIDLTLAAQDSANIFTGYLASDFSFINGLLVNHQSSQFYTGSFTGAYTKVNTYQYPNGTGVDQYLVAESRQCATCSYVGSETQKVGGRIVWQAYVDSSLAAGNDAFIKVDYNRIDVGGSSLEQVAMAAPVVLKNYTVATLPSTVATYMVACVSDALAPTWGATVVGGGAIKTIVMYDGSNWIVH